MFLCAGDHIPPLSSCMLLDAGDHRYLVPTGKAPLCGLLGTLPNPHYVINTTSTDTTIYQLLPSMDGHRLCVLSLGI